MTAEPVATSAPTIDPEFHGLIPPLSTEEREQLKANIVADGCREGVMTTAILLTHVRQFAAARRQRVKTTRFPPQSFPATEEHEQKIRDLWGLSLGAAKAFLPVSTNGKQGAARRYYFVVRNVERFLESLPTSTS